MAKLRLGVAILVPPPLDREIDAFRRATGDGTYGRIPAHLTLVPPVNVREDHLGEALDVLRSAAARTVSVTLDLGPPTTFLPNNPVLYLPVLGDGPAWLEALRERVFAPPLARPLTWPFVPHVTIADEADPERIAAAQVALRGYTGEMPVDRVHLLREGEGRVWAPCADFAFRPASVIGRGGLPIELTFSERLDPDGVAFADREWAAFDESMLGIGIAGHPFAITARRDERVVGVAECLAGGGVARLTRLIVGRADRGCGVGSHLLAAFESEARRRGQLRMSLAVLVGSPAEGFYRSRGWVDEARLPRWYGGHEFLLMRRDG